MSDTLTMEARKCRIEEVFDPSFIELLKLVPANPYVRGLVLKLTGKMPTPESETFEQLKDWVEFNCSKRIRKSAPAKNSDEGGVIINVEFSETEYGRASYSVSRSGSEPFRIGAGEVTELIQDAITDGRGIEDVIDTIAARIKDEAWDECDPGMDNYGDYDYDDHESSDSGNGEIDFSRQEIRNVLLRFLHDQRPELADQL